MLFKDNMRPAFATAGAASSEGSFRSKIKDFFTKSEQSADDDFGSFGAENTEKARRTAPPRQDRPRQAPQRPHNRRRRPSQIQWRPIITIGAAVAAVALLLTVILIVVCAAPAKNFEASDDVYTTIIDSKGKYRIVSNGELLDEEFAGEIKLIPSANNSFAYVEVKVTSGTDTGIEMYILEDDELSKVRTTADEIVAYAEYEPGIIYRDDQFYMHYTLDEEFPIISAKSASGAAPKNFYISGDASTVVYTTTASGAHTSMYYFSNGISLPVTAASDFTPVRISNDGSYIYGVKYSNYDVDEEAFGVQTLVYLYTDDEGESYSGGSIASLNTYGALANIQGINVDGDEIIFSTVKGDAEEGNTTTSTYMFQVGGDKPQLLGEGNFTPIYFGNEVVCPETFINTYFECEKTETVYDEDDNAKTVKTEYTLFLEKGVGMKKVADAKGTFSPDGDYFYYIDKTTTNLMKVDLDSDDFKEVKTVMNYIHSFCVIDNGDLYIMRIGGNDLGYISYYDSSTGKPLTVDSKVDINSMSQCADSIFFTKTDVNGLKTVYIATESATAEIADFDGVTAAQAPVVNMGSGTNAYIYIRDKSGKDFLMYTSDGTDFSNVTEGACRIPGFSATTTAPESGSNNTSNSGSNNTSNSGSTAQ